MSNEACRQFWALPESDLLGKTVSELPFSKESNRQSIQSVDERVLETGELLTFEESLYSAQGVEEHFLTTKGPILDENGSITGLFGIARISRTLRRPKSNSENSRKRLNNLRFPSSSRTQKERLSM